MKKRSIAILGCTGSIGTQALLVVNQHPDLFDVVALCAHKNHQLLFEQVRKYRPKLAGLTSGEVAIPDDLTFCEWYFGQQALEEIAVYAPCDDVLVSVVGMVGLQAVLMARSKRKRVLLANKEALVAGGNLVMSQCSIWGDDPTLIPVDSEHSAIFQCLQGAQKNSIDHILLTASGGPFRTWSRDQIAKATLQDALKHPNWNMGNKITIDSATMFNKALEIIEAKWLFGMDTDQIHVLIHPQSIVHSMIAYQDGAVVAQLGKPDMRVPIAYAMSYPKRLDRVGSKLSPEEWGTLQFEQPDEKRFPALRLVRQALATDDAAGCILNAANEVAVSAFLNEKISFISIAAIVEETLNRVGSLPADTLDHVLFADQVARKVSNQLITKISLEEA